MKLIIAGSRGYHDEDDFYRRMADILAKNKWMTEVTEVVSGTARGADTLGEEWAALFRIPVTRMPADWDRYGRSAGFIRNGHMAIYADALVAFWNGVSPGTRSMIDLAKGRGLIVHIEMI